MNDKPNKAIWIFVGGIGILSVALVCIQVAIPWLTHSTPYSIPAEFRCDPQPFPTTIAELPSIPIDWSPLAITDGI
jgi:hypothetical protein